MRRLLLATAFLCATSMAEAAVILGPDPNLDPESDPDTVPNTIDDTDRFQAAFTGPQADGTVILAAGHYYLRRPVLVNLTRFLAASHGVGGFRGAGKGRTVIHRNAGPAHPEGFPPVNLEGLGTDSSIGTFSIFQEHGDSSPYTLTVSGMTVSAEGRLRRWHPHGACNFDGFQASLFDVLGELGRDALATTRIYSTWDNLELIGHDGPPGEGSNLFFALNFIGGGVSISGTCPPDTKYAGDPYRKFKFARRLGGTFTVTRSDFKNNDFTIRNWNASDAIITIGGSPSMGNTFSDVGFMYENYDLDNSVVIVSHNSGTNVGAIGVHVAQAAQAAFGFDIPNDNSESPGLPNLPFPRSSVAVVDHNRMDLIDTADGIVPEDLSLFSQFLGRDNGGKTLLFEASANQISMRGTTFVALRTFFTDGAVFANNVVQGAGYGAIFLEGCTNCLAKGNNVHHTEPFCYPDDFYCEPPFNLDACVCWAPYDSYPITLTDTSSTCTVVGVDPDDVQDFGTDNIVAGAKAHGGRSTGSSVSAGMWQRRQLWKFTR